MFELIISIVLAFSFHPTGIDVPSLPTSRSILATEQPAPILLESYVATKGSVSVNISIYSAGPIGPIFPATLDTNGYYIDLGRADPNDKNWYIFNSKGKRISGAILFSSPPIRIGGWTIRGNPHPRNEKQ
jgi:hypothetical protein